MFLASTTELYGFFVRHQPFPSAQIHSQFQVYNSFVLTNRTLKWIPLVRSPFLAAAALEAGFSSCFAREENVSHEFSVPSIGPPFCQSGVVS